MKFTQTEKLKKFYFMCFIIGTLINPVCYANTALTIALTVGELIVTKKDKLYYIRVESTAANESVAVDQALREAVERAVGTLLVSKQEIKNNVVTKNEILKHSSGYIETYKILSSVSVGNLRRVVVDAWVTQSRIADRLLIESSPGAGIKGDQIEKTYGSYGDQKKSAEIIVKDFLQSFPAQAFEIGISNTLAEVSGDRLYIVIRGKIRLQDTYVAALSDLVARTGGKKSKGLSSFLDSPNIKIMQRTRWTSDEYEYSSDLVGKIIEAAGEPNARIRPVFRASVTDSQGLAQFSACFNMYSYTELSPINNFFPHKHFDSVVVDGNVVEDFSLPVQVSQNYFDLMSRGALKKSENVNVEVVRATDCGGRIN